MVQRSVLIAESLATWFSRACTIPPLVVGPTFRAVGFAICYDTTSIEFHKRATAPPAIASAASSRRWQPPAGRLISFSRRQHARLLQSEGLLGVRGRKPTLSSNKGTARYEEQAM